MSNFKISNIAIHELITCEKKNRECKLCSNGYTFKTNHTIGFHAESSN